MKMYWLSKPTTKATGSIAVYLDSWEAVERLLVEGVFLIGANAAYAIPFIQMERPLRFYRCNQYGHQQARCKALQPKCGRCAEPHETRDCTGTSLDKCAACTG